jgi:hypothetical protein
MNTRRKKETSEWSSMHQLKNMLAMGTISEKEYNMIERAMDDPRLKVTYSKSETPHHYYGVWTIELEVKIEK